MSRRPSGAPISLFAFQDAITSVCGVVVLVTLMLALALTRRVVTEVESSAATQSQVDETRTAVEKLEGELAAINAEVAETTDVAKSGVGLSLAEVKTRLANAKSRLVVAQDESREYERRIEALELEKQGFPELEKKIEALKRQTATTLQEAAETTAEVFSQESAVYSFSDSVREKPWYVEVAGSKLVAHGGADGSEALSFPTAFAFVNWATTRSSRDEYFVLIARPSGAKNYSFVVAELENAGYRYGVDLVGENRELVFLASQGGERR